MKRRNNQVLVWALAGALTTAMFLDLPKESALSEPSPLSVADAIAEEDKAVHYVEVERILDASRQMKEGVFVVQFPRTDLNIRINDEPMPIALGFTSWAAFKNMGGKVMVMGDLVLLEKEINPVISALADADINVTALHRHFLGEEPRVMYMHIHGMGEAVVLARGIRKALDLTATPNPKPSPEQALPKVKLDTNQLEEIIGHKGQVGGGVFKITVGRPGVKLDGVELTSSMGMNSWAAFVGTDERAHVAGDIVMTPEEVNKVIRTLRKGGIDVVVVHNHMLEEEPRIFFLHYWGTGTSNKLAQTVREAFDEVKEPVR